MSNLKLELVTDQEIIDYTTSQSSDTWKGRLSVEEYVQKQYHTTNSALASQDPKKFTGLFVFVFKNLDLPDTDKFSQIVSSCETMNRMAYIVKDGEIKELVAPCIGSVYCIPDHRKRGYTAKMIDALNRYWEERLPNESFMFLYSEIGEYYSRVGYKSFEVPVHKIKFKDNFQPTESKEPNQFLRYEQYGDLISKFGENLREDLLKQSQNETKVIYSASPYLSQFTWFHIRDIYDASKIRKDVENPMGNNFGAMLDEDNYVIWNHEWNGHGLAFVKLQVTSLENLKTLFQISAKECKEFQLEELYFWNTTIPEPFRAKFREYLQNLGESSTEFDLENGSVSAIRPLDEKIRDDVDYIWEQNEKWCWF